MNTPPAPCCTARRASAASFTPTISNCPTFSRTVNFARKSVPQAPERPGPDGAAEAVELAARAAVVVVDGASGVEVPHAATAAAATTTIMRFR
ncbi:hypothetical protein GCM10009648_17620 [Tsukamurella spumae]